MDCIEEKGVIDFTLNKLLCDFLIDSNCCILNGRNKYVNNYTFTGVQGLSVVDYCLVPYEYLNMFDRFTVTTATELINNAEIVDEIQRSTTKPDHSVLSWNFNLPIYSRVDSRPQPEQSFTWFDRTNVPGDFLGDSLEQLNAVISRLETEISTQDSINEAYAEIVKEIRQEMVEKLRHKKIPLNSNSNNKKNGVSKNNGGLQS